MEQIHLLLFVPKKALEFFFLFLFASENFEMPRFVPLCFWKVLDQLSLLLFASKKFWNISVCSILFQHILGIPLIVPLCSWKYLEQVFSFLFVPESFLKPLLKVHWHEISEVMDFQFFALDWISLVRRPAWDWNFFDWANRVWARFVLRILSIRANRAKF